MFEITEALDMLQFFGGQRAGRELWADKPTDVQNADIESFNEKIKAIRAYIRQLEAQNAELLKKVEQLQAERDAALENIRGDCVYCLHLCEDTVAPSCFDCANKGYYRWEWRGVQKEVPNEQT